MPDNIGVWNNAFKPYITDQTIEKVMDSLGDIK